MKRTHTDEPYFSNGLLFTDPRPHMPMHRGDYVALPGDLVLTPENGMGIVTDVRGDYPRRIASVRLGDGGWVSIDVEKLNPALTNEPRPRTANFSGILQEGMESFAPGFRVELVKCDGCHSEDIDLVELDGQRVCPRCASEIDDSSTRNTNEHE